MPVTTAVAAATVTQDIAQAITRAIKGAEHPVVLETPAQLEAADAAWSRCAVLGIDTEFVRERTYRAGLGLVQVSDGETAWLWDPLCFGSAEPIARLLAKPDSIKVLHSGSEDLEVLLHSIGTIPEPLVDTQVACAMLGQPLQLSYQGAVKWLFGVDVDKEHTRSNWLKRPLQQGQLRYAAMDVVLLPRVLAELRPRLEQAGRWGWLQEEVTRMQRSAAQPTDPDEAYLRIGGAGRLDGEGLLALRALARWREQTARARDSARGFVVPDTDLLELARRRPATLADLRAAVQMHPNALKRYEKALLQTITAAAADPAPPPWPAPLDKAQMRQLDSMKKRVQERATALDVDPALLASRRELEKLLRATLAGEPPPERFLGWRKAVITDELLAIIR
jgi:ribonuclease D